MWLLPIGRGHLPCPSPGLGPSPRKGLEPSGRRSSQRWGGSEPASHAALQLPFSQLPPSSWERLWSSPGCANKPSALSAHSAASHGHTSHHSPVHSSPQYQPAATAASAQPLPNKSSLAEASAPASPDRQSVSAGGSGAPASAHRWAPDEGGAPAQSTGCGWSQASSLDAEGPASVIQSPGACAASLSSAARLEVPCGCGQGCVEPEVSGSS
mmetsp:Transcript_101904/g.297169  ORF Transcript_101904/g.297169 Transcript_101904/m.297169 type:complete len:212 (+) Transcript_101904:1174-1809(+)